MRRGTDPTVRRMVSDLMGANGSQDLSVTTRFGGVYIQDGRLYGHWGRIGAARAAGKYGHREIVPNGDGTYYDPIAVDPANASNFTYGSPDRVPACEVGANPNVQEGAIVWLEPSRQTASYDFFGGLIALPGSSSGGSGPDDRCTGTVASVPYWRTTCIDGIEYLTSWLDTWRYNDLGCLAFTRGDSTTTPIGCCDCDTPPPPPPPPPALCADRIAAMGLQAPTLPYTFTGSCAPVAGASVTLTYDAGNNWYAYTGAVGTCTATFPFNPVDIKLACLGDFLQLTYKSGSGVDHTFTEGDATFPLIVVSEPPDPIYIAFQDFMDPGGPGTTWCVSPPSDCSDGGGTIVE